LPEADWLFRQPADFWLLLFRSFGFTRFPCSLRDQPQSGAFVDRYMVGFVTLDEILGFFSRRVMHVPFEVRVGSDLPDDDSAHMPSLTIPLHMITDFELH
jgi:hypothetical protein